ncbi:diaminopropionate ammonia-lyase [Candidatus Enterococcus ferrettii]|uniref:Diaminopropionate ammonia-lyase n=1 Tax=Candidatus Enterococcus ferrettii TaxID=2815324 RepID=A0ABV0ENL0_9ENTE|nr:diaminopropionate ammonia-lyase [Enterococcus sp. 665A]MBO1340045.1 diaminopropionate ammonia-lyase [Enterococcus sp. 665A]
MTEPIKAVHYERAKNSGTTSVEAFGAKETKKIWDFHQSFPEYTETPLVNLKNLAEELGVEDIYVKDESYRFGLNAFKVLGGSYCLASVIADKLAMDISDLPYEKISSEEMKQQVGDITFVTATDGNHGRGIAWTAERLGQKSVVYMPRGSAQERLENIQKLGADASILELNYDDAVRFASSTSEKNDWVLVQDTAWEGYEDIPLRIMQGYTTMANEIIHQLQQVKPTHIFLQAGVGAMAGAITAFFADYYPGEQQPIIVIVEPEKADCLFKTASQADGKLQKVAGDMDTIMAGLACGEPCTIGWDILKDYADDFISMPDNVAAKGMRVLGNPLGDDPKVISGESGAAGLGLVAEVLEKTELNWLKEQLQLSNHSKILCISTEGDTDQESYRNIVWDGKYPSV